MLGISTTRQLNRLFKILDAVDQPIWQRDRHMKIIYANERYRQLAEVPPDLKEIAELDKEVKKLAQRAQETGESQCKRVKIVSGGKRLEFSVCETPFGEGTIGYATSTDDVAKAEEELKRYQEVQDQLLETSASAIAIYGPDQRLKYFNQAFVNLWKLEEAWLGTNPTYGEILETLREKRRLPEQADFRSFKQENLSLFNSLTASKEDFYFLPNERALRVIVIPHALGGLQFIYEDMTDRLALERSYNTLLAVQSETLANLNEGVAVFGESGKLTLSNSVFAKMWGLDEKFLTTEPFFSDIMEKTKQLYSDQRNWKELKEEIMVRALNRESITHTFELTNGTVLEIKTVPLPDGEILITFNDITASTLVERSLRERTEALEDADRLKTEFLTNVSYELRSPLTSIIGFTEILRKEFFGGLNDKQRSYLNDIFVSSSHLEALINDILDISSIEAGYMNLSMSQFNIHSMLNTIISLVQERIRGSNLNLELDCPESIGKMTADETRIKQVLFNILSNSIKFTPSGGKIVIGAREAPGEHIMFWIEDNGPGIEEAQLGNVFKKFEKSKVKGGTGLGLSVAKNLVELHGGMIEIKSTPGQGTRVTCLFPRNCEQIAPVAEAI